MADAAQPIRGFAMAMSIMETSIMRMLAVFEEEVAMDVATCAPWEDAGQDAMQRHRAGGCFDKRR
jgi:hypothetical protein